MATEKWIGGSGVGFTWTDVIATASLNTIAIGNAIAGSVIDNTSALDEFMDVSIHLASLAVAAPNYIGVYLYPLNAGAPGTVYGDGRFGSSAAGPPPAQYMVGTIGLVVGTSVQDGILRGIIMPPNKFKIVLHNALTVAFASSGNTAQYWTYNRSVA